MKTFLSLGAGVQSSTLLFMAIKGEIRKPDAAIFADTGWEPKRVYEWLRWMIPQAEAAGIPVYNVQRSHIREDTLADYRSPSLPFYIKNPDGSQGKLWRQCTQDYKIRMVQRAIKGIYGLRSKQHMKENVTVWKGISTDEIHRAKTSKWDVKWIDFEYPLLDALMSRKDCLEWMEFYGYPEPPKSSCIGCPFHDDAHWLQMKNESPDEWQEAIEFDREIRNMKGIAGEAYLHRSMIPLDQVELKVDPTDLYFAEECEGVCGV